MKFRKNRGHSDVSLHRLAEARNVYSLKSPFDFATHKSFGYFHTVGPYIFYGLQGRTERRTELRQRSLVYELYATVGADLVVRRVVNAVINRWNEYTMTARAHVHSARIRQRPAITSYLNGLNKFSESNSCQSPHFIGLCLFHAGPVAAPAFFFFSLPYRPMRDANQRCDVFVYQIQTKSFRII